MGSQTWILLSDPEMTHRLLVSHGTHTSGRPGESYGHDVYAVGGRGIVFADNNKKWVATRRAAMSILAPAMVNAYEPILQEEAAAMVVQLLAYDAASVNPKENAHLLSFNGIMRTCFGRRAETIQDPLFKDIMTMLDEGGKVAGAFSSIGSFLPWLSWVDSLAQSKKKAILFTQEYRDRIFKQLIKDVHHEKTDCMASRLEDIRNDYGLDDTDIMVVMSDLIVGGADTIAVSMRWALAILVHHPDVQERVYQEIQAFVSTHHRLPNFATDRDAFPFMISCQRECMRFRPTVPFSVPHRVTKDFVYNGFAFNKDDILLTNMYQMHRRSPLHDKPDFFIPDRFLDTAKTMHASANGDVERRDHYNFGWGRRICPGIYLAESEMFHAWVQLFSRCTVEPGLDEQGRVQLPDLGDFEDDGVVISPMPFTVRFIPRANALLNAIV
ncbi:cytochrome P450 [Gongronella butleri]|nr:cytochrome P450 [Gongronella butleri]